MQRSGRLRRLVFLLSVATATTGHAQLRMAPQAPHAPQTPPAPQVLQTPQVLPVPESENSKPNARLTDPDFAAFGQATFVWQYKPAFAARYSGPNSLSTQAEHSHSATVTGFLGWRPWSGGELFLNPEAARGLALSRLSGVGGFTNGELARTSGAHWTVYRARAFLRQTWNLDGDTERVEAEANQMAGSQSRRRWVLTLGNFSALDVFDDNGVAKDPRTDFLNWSLMTYGAWDYPADARGYSWGAAIERFHDGWTWRAGRFMLPVDSNGLRLNRRIMRSQGDVLEVERATRTADGRALKLRLLGFRNRAVMGGYADALALGQNQGSVPALDTVRTERTKWGMGASIEYEWSADATLFARLSANDGRSETYAFTEIDRSIAIGLTVAGSAWQRGTDRVGVALVGNGLSADHRNYLAAGGVGYFLGDGNLRYRPELIAESFYRWQLHRQLAASLNLQWIRNPGYNGERGPVRVIGMRLHADF